MFQISMEDLALDILRLFPDGIPADKKAQVHKIMQDIGILTGIIGALQSTAGEVFSQHRLGNDDIAGAFFDALIAIRVPQPVAKRGENENHRD